MVARGDSANLLSLGAIDFGLIVDATVIMVENIYRHLAEHRGPADAETRLGVIGAAAREMNRAIFFSAAIIITGFLPLFTLTGVEGHIFGPMAKTYAYALVGGLIATYTVSPALAALILPNRVEERDTPVVRALRALFGPLQRGAVAHRGLAIGWPWPASSPPGSGCGGSASNSCPSWRRATCGSAPPCRPRSRSMPATRRWSGCAP